MLPDPHSLLLFSLAALATLTFPGPAVAFISARSLSHGPLSGCFAALGVAFGGLLHVLASAMGLSAILLSSAEAFAFLKLIGGLYLVYIGLDRLLRPGAVPSTGGGPPSRSRGKVFLEGILVNATNPKTALFFLAFLPQFVRPEATSPVVQIVFLGVLYVLMGLMTDGAYALMAGGLRRLAMRRPGLLRAERYVTGSTLVGLGIGAAAGQRPAHW